MIKKLKPNKNNIETYLPIFSGFYQSYWSEPSFDGEADYYGLPDNFDFTIFLNWDDYYNKLSKYFCDCIESKMDQFIETIEFQRIYSPKEYNFSNDAIYCIIRPKKQAIQDYIYNNKVTFEKYLKDNLKSYDGFISHHSYDFDNWEINTKKFKQFDKTIDPKGFNLGFILSFIANNEEIDENNAFEDANGQVFVSEFLNKEFYELVKDIQGNEFINKENVIEANQSGWNLLNLTKEIQSIKDFVKNNYEYYNVYDLTLREFSDIKTGFLNTLSDYIYIEKIINFQINEIESHNLKLDLK